MTKIAQYSNDEDQDEESKTTSEKPVSLSPLNLKEALEGLLKIEPKENKNEDTKNDGDGEKSN